MAKARYKLEEIKECPKCSSSDTFKEPDKGIGAGPHRHCNQCGHRWFPNDRIVEAAIKHLTNAALCKE